MKRLKRPPRAAGWILFRILSDEEKEFILGDLDERSGRMSPLRARFWYWRQTLSFLRAGWRPRAVKQRRGDRIMRGILQDLRYGFRVLAKAPGFAVVASLTLAVGVGANATIFSWLNGVLITLLPGVERPHQLVAVLPKSSMQEFTTISYPDYVDFRDRTSTLSGLFVADDMTVNLGGEGDPERVWGQLVSGNFFDVLGVDPILGRRFLPEEDRVKNERPVVVVSHRLWMRRFGGDPSLVGRTIHLNEAEYVVVGVAPPDFQGSEIGLAYDLWVPMMMQEKVLPGRNRLDERNNSWLVAIGRLAPGISLGDAQAELDKIAREVATEHERPDDRSGAIVVSLWRSPRGAPSVLGPVLLLLMAVTGLVLLIACANVANLLLARATGRRKEIAVRLALGAGRGRILRQLLTESLILSVTSALAGVIVTYWTSGLLRALAPPTDLPIGLALGVDVRVWVFTFAVALLAAVAFGLAPAVHALRASVVTPLKEESSSVAGGTRKTWLRSGLVLSQVTLSLVLLIAAGLFLKSLRSVRTFHPGFQPKGVLLAAIDLFPSGYSSEKGRAFYVELLERLRSIPGVECASLARRVPLGFGGTSSSTLRVEGREPRKGAREWAYINNVAPDYFRTMEISLLSGRDFTTDDNATSSSWRGAPPPRPMGSGLSARVAIINETMARSYWPNENALGRRFSYGDDQWFTVVGIVADTKYRSLTEETAAFTYLPVLQFFRTDVTLHLRTAGDPTTLASAVQAEVHALDPALPLYDVRTLEEHVMAASFQQRMAGTLLSVLGAVALLLAGVGISSVVAYTASQRTREIGIRIALGASRGDVIGLMVRQGMWVVGLGLLVGVGVSLAATQLLRSLLFGTSPTDPLTFALVTAVLLGVGLAASYFPARRATRVDPVVALRYE